MPEAVLSCIVFNQRRSQHRRVDAVRGAWLAMRAAAPCARQPSLLRDSSRPGQRYRRPPMHPMAAAAAPPGDRNGGGTSQRSPTSAAVSGLAN